MTETTRLPIAESAPQALAPQRGFADHVYYTMTKTLCRVCKRGIDGKVLFRDGKVFLDKLCPDHGKQECVIASSVEWYLDALSFVAPNDPPKRVSKQVEKGCPFDCGACPQHQQKVFLPVVPITSACNLDCPICYTVNKNEHAYKTTADDMKRIVEKLKEDHEELDIINFTGGEPTLHPGLLDFLQICKDAGIKRLTISTNGLRLLDEKYVERLAKLDARIVLSLDTFRPDVDRALLGADTTRAKLKVIDLLEKHDVATTILPAVASGLNDSEVGKLLELVLAKRHVRSLELHTLTFTGQGGVGFDRKARITIPDLHRRIEESTNGAIRWRDFVPSPLAHPHCYSICYLLMLDGGGFVPFTRFLGRQGLFELLQDSLYIEPRPALEDAIRRTIDELWAEPGKVAESERILATLKRLLKEMFPTGKTLGWLEAQKISERSVKAIYVHSHMDEESFDVGRVMKCCVGVPSPDGSNIPTCSYNVLYREKDPRFADPGMLSRMNAARALPVLATTASCSKGEAK